MGNKKDLNKIKIKVKTPYGVKTFIFNMNKHFDGGKQEVMEKIALWIVRNADAAAWLKGPLWMILNVRVAHINPSHELWDLLDADAQGSPSRNYLMWQGHIKFDNTITITHFGPLGSNQEKTLKQDFQKYEKGFWADMMRTQGITSVKDLDRMSPPEWNMKMEQMQQRLDNRYLAIIKNTCGEIDKVKALLTDIIHTLYGVAEEGVKFTLLMGSTVAPTAMKMVLKDITVAVLKQIAKEIAELGAKKGAEKGGKIIFKKVPVVGLFAGVGLGVYRMLRGEHGRALLEVASGAASCVPGAGMVASSGIDAAIGVIDITEAVSIHMQQRDYFMQYSSRLEQLLSKQEKLNESYQCIKLASDKFDFEDDARDLMKAINYIDW